MEKQQEKNEPKTILKPIFGNPWKRNQVTGHVRVGVEDGTGPCPETLPDGTPLLTESQLMEKRFEKAGNPTKGSQPASDFKPD